MKASVNYEIIKYSLPVGLIIAILIYLAITDFNIFLIMASFLGILMIGALVILWAIYWDKKKEEHEKTIES